MIRPLNKNSRKKACENQSASQLYTPIPKELEGRYGRLRAFAEDSPFDCNSVQKAKGRPVPFYVAHYLLSAHGEKITLRDFIRIRKAAGRKIDPETAEVDWIELLHNCQVERVYFARSPESDIWVRFAALPKKTLARLCLKFNVCGPMFGR